MSDRFVTLTFSEKADSPFEAPRMLFILVKTCLTDEEMSKVFSEIKAIKERADELFDNYTLGEVLPRPFGFKIPENWGDLLWGEKINEVCKYVENSGEFKIVEDYSLMF